MKEDMTRNQLKIEVNWLKELMYDGDLSNK